MKVCLFGLLLVTFTSALDNGLARLPPLGWMSGERFECNVDCQDYPDDCISEQLVKSTADAMVSQGFVNAGYEYMLVGDCWMNKTRDSQKKLIPDPHRFPSGMKSLVDYVHSKGLKLGLYLCAGNLTCQGYPGSQDYLKQDAQTLAEWGVDLVRLDACHVKDPKSLDNVYPEMGRYLNETGRQMLYYCDWPFFQSSHGMQPKYDLISKTCNVYHSYQDMRDSWTSLDDTLKWYVNHYRDFLNFSKPGSWNLVDQTLVGNYGLSPNQERIQLSVWTIMASPLFVSADLRHLKPEAKQLLLNQKMLKVTKDELGVMGFQKRLDGQVHIWVKPILPKGSFALALHYNNISGGATKVSVKLEDLGLTTAGSYQLREVFTDKDMGIYKPWFTLNVEVEPTGAMLITCEAKYEEEL